MNVGNILKTIELFILNEQILWYVNYISIKLSFRFSSSFFFFNEKKKKKGSQKVTTLDSWLL